MNSEFATAVVSAISSVVGNLPVALHEPSFGNAERDALLTCLESTFVSSVGKYVDKFEIDLATYTGAKCAVAVVNGTAALHVALRCAGVNERDEVLVPALSFVATANAVSYCGAIPHFIDSDNVTLGVDPESLRSYLDSIAEIRSGSCVNRLTGRVIRALVPMHTFGHPVNLEGVLSVANDFKLTVIEDAAESLGSFYHGRHTGTFGVMGVLSFNGNKIITTGGGGAILTNDISLARRIKHITTTAKLPHRWEYSHDEIGFNYRMPNLNAAIGCAQLESLPAFLSAKKNLYKKYETAFQKIPGVTLIKEPLGCDSNYWLQTLALEKTLASERDTILDQSNRLGIMTRPAWTLLHKLSPYKHAPRMPLNVAEELETRLINIPSSAKLGLGPSSA
jgi:perosamine synthetase